MVHSVLRTLQAGRFTFSISPAIGCYKLDVRGLDQASLRNFSVPCAKDPTGY
jgi:hypothetical protein